MYKAGGWYQRFDGTVEHVEIETEWRDDTFDELSYIVINEDEDFKEFIYPTLRTWKVRTMTEGGGGR